MGTTKKALEMPLTNCEINLILTRSENYVLTSGSIDGQVPTFAITDTKLYVSVVTLSTKDNVKLLEQLKSSVKRLFFKHQSKVSIERQNQYLMLVFKD